MKIKELSVKNFTVFDEARFEFSPGLNVIIGENGTGKSHLLKLMYSVLKGSEDRRDSELDDAQADAQASLGVLRKLRGVFLPEGGQLERLLRRPGAKEPASVRLATDAHAVEISIRAKQHRHDAPISGFEGSPQFEFSAPCLFLPPPDVLALYEGFIGSYAKRALSLDETYNDLCIALNANLLREEPAWAIEMLRRIEKQIGGKVVLKGERFYVGKLEAHLVAAGYRKLAEIVRLIANGTITPETVLFWDEPEAGLNPQLIGLVSEVLLLFARGGMQVFVATHDFLLTTQLSLAAEHPGAEANKAVPRFFSLDRPKSSAAVEVESGATIADIQHNAILAAFAAHYDREQQMFVETTPDKT
jgi:energy-coupling factor transporter ATP-binding protein EcfA2